ncbi:hypothetical protein Salat_2892300 [Sesamum alatum]|uniref:Uncharacterized protein n=1 Tax=Sesamum alatum TaxID=300844 RepID=A0AAE1XJB8_9LAMI|nr:hypothetical protein Salat_2892300 [Sesamum alatum]
MIELHRDIKKSERKGSKVLRHCAPKTTSTPKIWEDIEWSGEEVGLLVINASRQWLKQWSHKDISFVATICPRVSHLTVENASGQEAGQGVEDGMVARGHHAVGVGRLGLLDQ